MEVHGFLITQNNMEVLEMSRSRKKFCGGGITTCRSDKKYKKQEHARERTKIKQLLNIFYDDTLIPNCKKWGNPWSSGKDGKSVYWWDWQIKMDKYKNDPWVMKTYRRLLRK
jgi:hypothetical protein